jgi:hypothetical protein
VPKENLAKETEGDEYILAGEDENLGLVEKETREPWSQKWELDEQEERYPLWKEKDQIPRMESKCHRKEFPQKRSHQESDINGERQVHNIDRLWT